MTDDNLAGFTPGQIRARLAWASWQESNMPSAAARKAASATCRRLKARMAELEGRDAEP